MTDKTIAATSYAGGVASVLSALTLTDVGIIVGVLTALLTFAMNVFYQRRKDRREQQAHELYVKNLLGGSHTPAHHHSSATPRETGSRQGVGSSSHMSPCPTECPYAKD